MKSYTYARCRSCRCYPMSSMRNWRPHGHARKKDKRSCGDTSIRHQIQSAIPATLTSTHLVARAQTHQCSHLRVRPPPGNSCTSSHESPSTTASDSERHPATCTCQVMQAPRGWSSFLYICAHARRLSRVCSVHFVNFTALGVESIKLLLCRSTEFHAVV